MKLIRIEIIKPTVLCESWRKGFWYLGADFYAIYHTDEGAIHLRLRAGWITDLRSGSSAVDCIVPKSGSPEYNAIIILHDASYSGHLTKALADDILRQGLVLCGLAEWRATAAYRAVWLLGGPGYYEMEDVMPVPYTYNRNYESLQWLAK